MQIDEVSAGNGGGFGLRLCPDDGSEFADRFAGEFMIAGDQRNQFRCYSPAIPLARSPAIPLVSAAAEIGRKVLIL